MMRAILIQEYRGPEVLRPTDLPILEPSRGEALVRVKAVSVNGFLDISHRMGQVAFVHSSPSVPAPGPGGADRR
jgi:NADPH:quinone reductase-like Zn-dependent oxidoreductase